MDSLPVEGTGIFRRQSARESLQGVSERRESLVRVAVDPGGREVSDLDARQVVERLSVAEKYRSMGVVPATSEVAEILESLKSRTYSALGIHPDLESNGTLGKFRKGFVDVLFVENVDFVKTVLEVGFEKVLSALKDALLSVPNLLRLFEEVAEDLRKKAEGALRFEPYSMGGASATLASGAFGMVRSAAKTATKSEILSAVRFSAEGVNRTSHFRIELGKPPAFAGRHIYECAELLERETVRKGGAEVAKAIDLVRTTGAYLRHHGHEVEKLPKMEQNYFHGSVDLLVRQTSRILADKQIPMVDREAIRRAFVQDFQPYHKTVNNAVLIR